MSAASPNPPERLRVCMDADALFAGSASVSGASHVILQLGELRIIDIGVPDQARIEAERNLRVKVPAALPAFRTLVDACTTPLVMAPLRTSNRLARSGEADSKDAPILAAAIAGRCQWLVTFNVRDYRTDQIQVSLPGQFLEELRAMLVRQGRR